MFSWTGGNKVCQFGRKEISVRLLELTRQIFCLFLNFCLFVHFFYKKNRLRQACNILYVVIAANAFKRIRQLMWYYIVFFSVKTLTWKDEIISQFIILTVFDFQILSSPSKSNWPHHKGACCYFTVILVWTVLTLCQAVELPHLRHLVPLARCHFTVKVEKLVFRTGQLANGEFEPYSLVVCW